MAAAGLERRRLGSSTWQMRQDPSPSDFSTDTGTGPYSRPPHHLPYKNIQRHPRLLSREILRRTADYQRLQKQPCRHLWNFALLRSCAPTELQKLLQMHAPPIQRLLGNLQPSPFHYPHHPNLRMLRNNSLFPLTHVPNSATPTRIIHFFIALMVKWEICVNKQL